MSKQKIIVNNLDETKKWVMAQVEKLHPRQVVLLSGDLGAGKTQVVQFFTEALGSQEVCSPSFAIHNEYELANGNTADHIDLYRLEDEADLESVGFWDLFSKDNGIIFIEWANRLDIKNIPRNWQILEVKLCKLSETTREITW